MFWKQNVNITINDELHSTHKWQVLEWGRNKVCERHLHCNKTASLSECKRSNRNKSNQSHETDKNKSECLTAMRKVAYCTHVHLSISTCVPQHKSYLSALLSNPKSSGLAACTEKFCHHLKYTLIHTTKHSGRFLATRGVPEPQWNQEKKISLSEEIDLVNCCTILKSTAERHVHWFGLVLSLQK